MVALEERFLSTPDGSFYSQSSFDYRFWQRYLKVFDEVVIFARAMQVPDKPSGKTYANGLGVKFLPLPCFIGPWQYLMKYFSLASLARKAVKQPEAFILRIPGIVSTLLWYELRKRNIPFGVEVVGDPWDSLAAGSVKSISRPYVRWKFARVAADQCRGACAASYVTRYSLQKKYPPGGWSTDYSSVELPVDAIADEGMVRRRVERIKAKADSGGPWFICYAGTMAQLYKAPDILIDAAAKCVSEGINLKLIMLGDGQYKTWLRERAKKLGTGNKVEFVGMVPPGRRVLEYFDEMDLYVLPSRQEGLPRSVIEAMARGLPCIGSTVGGFSELLEPEFLVAPADVEMLYEKLKYVISNADMMKKAVSRNIEIAREYTADVLELRRIEFYEKVKNMTIERTGNV
ncbi:MAG: glycosyltransferase family 4 protein [Planctomycetes bacterium]|nr:glycosyltransferase family 4 protein [Planctomycetota bacterium]MBU1518340.1 glycosyltransferase family 4 protein [Planctomycetota bacterium]MBU2458567.1 glycosyltransferase family 4 protein [Planctomycetota bacterium]